MKPAPKIALLALMLCQTTLHALPVVDNAAPGVKLEVAENIMEIIQPAEVNVAINDWRSFDIAEKEHVHFAMLENAISVNRVLGNNQSQILGKLSANGKLILVNPNGFLFGKGSEVNSGSFIATASDISRPDLMQGHFKFDNTSGVSGRIIHEGTITVRDAGVAALVAPHVENHGTINAKLGVIALGSGRQFTLDLHGDGLIHFAADTDAESRSLIQGPEGKLLADGGRIQITSQGARQVLNNTINLNGVVKANGVSVHKGQITLSGGKRTNIRVAGKLQARRNGTIKIHSNQTSGEATPPAIEIASTAHLDTSSKNIDAGDIIIGSPELLNHGNTAKITVMPGAKLIATSGSDSGNGGRIVLAASDEINMMGSAILTKNGTFKTVSGKDLDISHADVSAKYGSWKIEAPIFELDDINTKPINAALAENTDVQIRATSMLRLSNDEKPVTWNTPANLTLYARKHLEVSPDATVQADGAGNIKVRVDAPVNGEMPSMNFIATQIEPDEFVHVPSEQFREVDLEDDFVDVATDWKESAPHLQPADDFIQISPVIKPRFVTNSGDISFQYSSSEWDRPHDFSPYFASKSGKATQYLLVGNATELQQMAGFLDQNFALKGNINLDQEKSHQPIGDARKPYRGQFEGNHYSITHLRVHQTEGESGLFGAIKNAKISNVHLKDIAVSGNHVVGGLVGTAEHSELFNVTSEGNVSGIGSVGGIVGYASATDMNHLSANVKVIEADIAGGLVGSMQDGSSLFSGKNHNEVNSNQQAGGIVGLSKDSSLCEVKNCGAVSGKRNVGGIVGSMQGHDAVLTTTHNLGVVHGTQWVGGLVGTLQDRAILSNGQNSGEVRGEHHVGGIVGRNLLSSKVRLVKNLANVNGIENVGGIGGFQDQTSISQNIKMLGQEVHGDGAVGGLYGTNYGSITQGFNMSFVDGDLKVGGVVGSHESGIIEHVTNAASRIHGQMEVGGLAGNVGAQAVLRDGKNFVMAQGIKYIGSIVGVNNGLVEQVVNHAENVHGETKVGAISGENTGIIQNAISDPIEIYQEIAMPEEIPAENVPSAVAPKVLAVVAPLAMANSSAAMVVPTAEVNAPGVVIEVAEVVAPAVLAAPMIVPPVPVVGVVAPAQVFLKQSSTVENSSRFHAISHVYLAPKLQVRPTRVYISGVTELLVPKIMSASQEEDEAIHLK